MEHFPAEAKCLRDPYVHSDLKATGTATQMKLTGRAPPSLTAWLPSCTFVLHFPFVFSTERFSCCGQGKARLQYVSAPGASIVASLPGWVQPKCIAGRPEQCSANALQRVWIQPSWWLEGSQGAGEYPNLLLKRKPRSYQELGKDMVATDL